MIVKDQKFTKYFGQVISFVLSIIFHKEFIAPIIPVSFVQNVLS
jgi:hypothetical protein